jgi:RNA polymerase sigma factor (sigma-70 family)
VSAQRGPVALRRRTLEDLLIERVRDPTELSRAIGKEHVMGHAQSDASVIAASLAEPERFAEIFDRHFATVFRFAERRVGRDQAAEVASEVLARAFAKRASFRSEAVDALPWLLGIASKLILHERRRFVRYLAAVERASAETRVVDPEDDLAAADRRLDAPADRARMRAALLTLSDVDRELLLLVAWDELSYEEVAAVLELPVGTVRSKLHRAKASLRELLESNGRTPGDRSIPTPKEATAP